MIMDLIERFRHLIILGALTLSALFAFGFDTFPIIEENTNYFVMGLSIVGILVYYLYYVRDQYEEPYYEPETQEVRPPTAPTSSVEIVQKPLKVVQPTNTFKEIEQKERELDRRLKALESKEVVDENDVFSDFEEVKNG